MSDILQNEIQFSNPYNYHIQVLGNVHQDLWDYFEGEIEDVEEDKNGQVITSLSVYVRDQAELSGLINMLYDSRHVLLLVKMNSFLNEETGH